MDPWAAARNPGRRSSKRFAVSRRHRSWIAVALAASAAPFADATLVGTTALDWAWSAMFAALGALAATRAKRGQLLAVAVVAAACAQTGFSLALAAIAIAMGVFSTRKLQRRAVFSRGVSGGAAIVSLLAAAGEGAAWQVALGGALVAILLGTSAWKNSPRSRRRDALVVVGLLFGLWGAASIAAAAGLATNADKLSVGSAELRVGLASARRGEAENAATHLARAHASMHSARVSLERYGAAARAFPGSAQQVEALIGVLSRLETATVEARRAAEVVVGDKLAVVGGTIDLDALMDLRTPLNRLSKALAAVVDEVDEYDGAPLLPPLRDRLEVLRTESWRAGDDAARGSEAAAALPDALGAQAPKRYLVLFTSPAEARGRFGFPGSFAEITMDDGRYRLGEHGSTSQILNALEFDQDGFQLGDPALRPYVAFGATRAVQAATIPPDFRTVARDVGEMWKQSGRAKLDGVLRFDASSLAPMLALTGPITVPGVPMPLTAANVEEFLVLGQYVQFPSAQAPRREVLQDVSDTVFERLETANLPNPRTLFDLFAPEVVQGHLHAASFTDDVADLLGHVGMDGRFDAPTSDGFMVTTVNGLGNKIDSFLTTNIGYRGTVKGHQADITETVRLVNGAPGSGLPDYVIGSFDKPAPPTGTNRMTVFLYTALPATSITVDGQPAAQAISAQTVGWWVHTVVVDLPPGGAAEIGLQLSGELPDGPYQLVLEPAGGANPEVYSVDVAVGDRHVTHEGRRDRRVLLK